LLRPRQSCGTRANDGDLLARTLARRLRLNPAFRETTIDDLLFYKLDRYGIVIDPEYTRRLARGRTDPSRELGKIVGRMKLPQRLVPAAPPHQIVPVGDQVIDRTAGMAKRN